MVWPGGSRNLSVVKLAEAEKVTVVVKGRNVALPWLPASRLRKDSLSKCAIFILCAPSPSKHAKAYIIHVLLELSEHAMPTVHNSEAENQL